MLQLIERRRDTAERRILEAFGSTGWHYGLDLMCQARLRSGRFYPALRRLEQAGWVEATWDASEPEPRRRRRMYRLSFSILDGASEADDEEMSDAS